MFQIGLSAPKKAVPVLSALAAMGAAGLASQAVASTTITIDPYVPAVRDADSPLIKYTDSSYFGNNLQDVLPWTTAQAVEANNYKRDYVAWFTWNYDFSALAGKTIESATLILGPQSNSYGFTSGNHITVAAPSSPIDLRTGLVGGAFHDPYTNSVTQVFPNGGSPDGINSVAMPFDMTDMVTAWAANSSTFNGVEIWSTDAAQGKGWVWNPGGQYGPTNGGKLVITYSVPEPAIVGLGASVGGLALLRRRRS